MKIQTQNQVPETMLLPDIDADFHLFLENYDTLKLSLLLADPVLQLEPFDKIDHFSAIYFNILSDTLRVINYLINGNGAEDIGMQLSTPHDTAFVFPNSINTEWVI